MNVMTDAELIRAYVEQHSEAAFAELVNRHLGFVYSSALRQVQQPDLAADVAQAVFLLLSRKAVGLRREVVLSGWLFRTTRFLASRTRRSEVRRQHHEQDAVERNYAWAMRLVEVAVCSSGFFVHPESPNPRQTGV